MPEGYASTVSALVNVQISPKAFGERNPCVKSKQRKVNMFALQFSMETADVPFKVRRETNRPQRLECAVKVHIACREPKAVILNQ